MTISNITQLLRYAVDTDVFGNRATGTSADPSGNPLNFGVGDGFMAGDLIFVRTGTKVTLDLDISPEVYSVSPSPFNNPNENNSSQFSGIDLSTTAADAAISELITVGDYTSASTITRTNIKRVLTAPLLIRLVNAADLPSAPA